jgi:putative ABC transport system permease protein
MIYLVFCLVYVAVGILLLNAMLMAVFERIREFGVLKAVGMGPWQVFVMILAEGAVQVGVALAVGLLACLPAMWYLAMVGVNVGALGGASVMGVAMRQVWHGAFTPASISGPVVTLIAIVFLAILYPALRAAWIRPVSAMVHQ